VLWEERARADAVAVASMVESGATTGEDAVGERVSTAGRGV